MFDDLASYYDDNVVTEFVAYRDTSKDGVAGRSRDLRKALVAATALFHLREHLTAHGVPSRRDIEKQCPDYALLGDIVNSAKHREITQNTPHGAPLVNQAERLAERQVVVEYDDAAGEYRHGVKTVVVTLTDGSERNLLEVLTNVINFWESHLLRLGVLTSARVFSYEDPFRFRVRSDCNDGRLDLQIVRGQRLKQSVQLLRFNETSGKAEPVDLTGTTLRAAMYKPSPEFELVLTNESSGTRFKRTAHLSEAESLELSLLTTESERQSYLFESESVRRTFLELAIEAGLHSGEPVVSVENPANP